jgi:hypothetical protein
MIENVMHHIGGVGIFGIISICLFFAFFFGLLVWAVALKQPYVTSMRDLPLDNAPETKPEPPLQNRHA